ncbi:hypothetical protein GDO78_018488 [Eleutherodactylus coqui]|uniref:Sequestosome 1 n=1 Tax=Eleutherodactylus coqui TaxID=57060 RepID=A0A8J6E6U4_ELECQ|nr:hypothetical protein GDO78_018488 [Eleutherodactylus coqui]
MRGCGWARSHETCRIGAFVHTALTIPTATSAVREAAAIMPVTVKAYLLGKDESHKEIRRFTLQLGAGRSGTPEQSSCQLLSDKVTDVFKGLRGGAFQMFYRDEEGDLVAFSTDEELNMGVEMINDGGFRLYIKEKRECKREHRVHCASENTPNVVHPNVTCDGCEGPVVGNRFKCLICPDYDLCSTCETKGIHKEHNMIMFPTPIAFPHGRWLRKMRHGMPPFPWMHGWGLPGRGHPCPNAQPPQGCSAPTNLTAPQEGDSANPSQPCSDPNVAFLQNIGESVAAMLSPLGIDVDIDVEHGGKRSKVSSPQPEAKDTQPSSISSSQNPQSGNNRSEEDSAPMDTDIIAKQMENVHLNSHSSNEQSEHSGSASGGDDDWTHVSPKEIDPSTGELQSLQLLETDGPSPLDPSRATHAPTGLREAALYPHLPAGCVCVCVCVLFVFTLPLLLVFPCANENRSLCTVTALQIFVDGY